MPTTKTVIDERAPIEKSAETTPDERFPLGAFVAYNGPSDDGQRRRAVVVDYADGGIELLDGADVVTVTGDDLANVIVLAQSADAYALRVSAKARQLGKEQGFCDLAARTIEQLNQTPEEDATESGQVFVVAVVTHHYAVSVKKDRTGKPYVAPNKLAAGLRAHYYVGNGEFDYTRFRTGAAETTSVELRLVDALPSTTDDAPASTD